MIIPICAFLASAAVTWVYHRYANPKRIYCNDEGWMPIDLIPEEERGRTILLTDGDEVYQENYRFREYNKNGQVVFSYDKKIATHWRRYPLPPMRKDR